MVKRLIRLFVPIVLAALFVPMARAQYDAQLSQYFLAMGYYNPAYAGQSDNINLMALHRQQWLGIEGAPKSFYIAADMPLQLGKLNSGVGLIVFTEGIGLFRNTHVALQYAYKLKLFGGKLSIGVQPGYAGQSFDGTKIHIPTTEYHQQTDEAIPTTKVSGSAFDINAGIYYSRDNMYLGFGASHLTEPEMQLDENSYTYLTTTYNLSAGYNIKLSNPLIDLQPSVFLKTDMESFQSDITARVVYDKKFNGGITWRVNESIVFLLGATLGGFRVGYAYDFPTTQLLRGTTGSHELVVCYSFKLNKVKTGKNSHKSVRIL